MQILIYGVGVCDTVDPLGGYFYVETLTNQFENAIRDSMKEVEKWGGMINAITTGKIQEVVSHQAYVREKAMQDGKILKVGVNCYRKEEENHSVEFHPYNEKAAEKQLEKLKMRRAERNNEKVKLILQVIKEDAMKNVNLMSSIILAVKEYATVGEIVGVLKEVYGEYSEPIFF